MPLQRQRHSGTNNNSNKYRDQQHFSSSHHHQLQHHHYHQNHHHRFSKQQFLQANCQFVVLDGHDYSVHQVDPDWPVDWDCIEEIKFKQCASTETTCPICLESPIAAKITKCGHIYCWPCMLHYLSLEDGKFRQCPICFEQVQSMDLRSVVSHSFSNYSVDEEISLTLMIRRKGCVIVQPYFPKTSFDPAISPKNFDITTTNTDKKQLGLSTEYDVHYLSRNNLVIVNYQTVLSKIIQRESDELKVKLAIDQDDPGVCFVEQALNLLNDRVQELNKKVSSNCYPKTSHLLNNNSSSNAINNHPNNTATTTAQQLDPVTKTYLFYQCSDGQHIYLNPFSTKILCQEYGSLENCAIQIRAKVLQMDWISMNEGWRKRFRYLEHLPLTCEFKLIEIDFEKSNLVSMNTLKIFEEQIRERKQMRDKLRREERKREKIIQVEQNRKIYGIQPSLKINLDNIDQFPSFSDERYIGLSMATSKQQNQSNFLSDNFEYSSGDDDDDQTNNGRRQTNIRVQDSRDGNRSTSSELNDAQPSTSASCQNVATPTTNTAANPVSNVTLSFRDIQLQEEMAVTSASKQLAKKPGPIWSKSTSASSQPAASFAKLLEDAKSSKLGWTVVPKSSMSSPSLHQSQNTNNNNPVHHHHHQHQNIHSASYGVYGNELDIDHEEQNDQVLAPPPGKFTIGDYIDVNVKTTGFKKKNGKQNKSSVNKSK